MIIGNPFSGSCYLTDLADDLYCQGIKETRDILCKKLETYDGINIIQKQNLLKFIMSESNNLLKVDNFKSKIDLFLMQYKQYGDKCDGTYNVNSRFEDISNTLNKEG